MHKCVKAFVVIIGTSYPRSDFSGGYWGGFSPRMTSDFDVYGQFVNNYYGGFGGPSHPPAQTDDRSENGSVETSRGAEEGVGWQAKSPLSTPEKVSWWFNSIVWYLVLTTYRILGYSIYCPADGFKKAPLPPGTHLILLPTTNLFWHFYPPGHNYWLHPPGT